MDRPEGLQRLVVETDSLAENEVADVLERYVRLTPEGDVVFHDAFGNLKAREQVLCLLLAFRASELLGLREGAGATPKEIVAASGIAGGTVRPKLSALVKDRLVAKADGRYSVPIHSISRAASAISPQQRSEWSS